MSTTLTKAILIITLLLSGKTWAAENEIKYEVSFENDTLTATTVEQGGKKYSDIRLGNLPRGASAGKPIFPSTGFSFSVPFAATDFQLEFTIGSEEEVTLPYPPLPGLQDSFALRDHILPCEVDLISPDDYENFPKIRIGREEVICGFNRIVTIIINPIQWTEDPNKILFVKKLDFKVSWRLGEPENPPIFMPRTREGLVRMINREINATKNKVVNPEDVERNAKKEMMEKLNSSAIYSPLPFGKSYPYVIVTTENLASGMERLAALRRLRGINTEVVTMDSILRDPEIVIGDYISGFTDDAGKLRSFLKFSYEDNNTRNTLLAGPYSAMPGRWVSCSPLASDTTWVPYVADQYYRDLKNPWPKGNTYSGRDIALVENMSQDMIVGRLSLSNQREINSYIDKLVQYEFNVNNTDLRYLENAYVLLSDDDSFSDNYNRYSNAAYGNNFSKVSVDSEALTGFHTGAQVMENMSKDKYGFMDWRGHGHYAGVTVSTKGNKDYGINALDSHKGLLEEESGNGLDNYRNHNYPSWGMSMSCNLAELGVNRGTYTFADSYTLGKDYGGVAFIGNSHLGLIRASSELVGSIFNVGNATSKIPTNLSNAGTVLEQGITSYINSLPKEVSERDRIVSKYVVSGMSLTGDPMVPLWFRKPRESSKDGLFSPSHLSLRDSIGIARYDFKKNEASNMFGTYGNYTGSAETLNSTMLRYRNDMLPYINPCLISGLTLSGADFGANRYIFTDRLRFANGGSANKSLLLTGNIRLTVEALGEVGMEGDIEVEAGSSLTVKSYKPITVADCDFTSGGSVTLSSKKEVVIDGKTEIPLGMEFNITLFE